MSVPSPVFQPVPVDLDFPRYERAILELWRERRILERSLEHRGEEAEPFVFYEGPPTANGLPHNGHVLTRVVKDLFPRYQAMRGRRVLRKGGWDTHGLPVEVEVEKELRIHGKAAIEEYGVRPFVARCIESVFRYTAEWERLTERIGFWVSLDDAYVTYHRSYVESVWWALSELFKKGLLYQGHKVVWWWAQGGTALSSAEVGLGYREVDDPSVYVVFPLRDDPDTGLVVWTTTPWTLPSNTYAAVRASTTYDYVRLGEPLAPEGKGSKKGNAARPPRRLELACGTLLLATELRAVLEQKIGHRLEVVRTVAGAELVGLRYDPPFDFYSSRLANARVRLKEGGDEAMWWRVIAEDFVTLDTGTGIVHIAPAFGEDDNRAHQRQLRRYTDPDRVELVCAIEPDGTFKTGMGVYSGRWVKDCDKELTYELFKRQRLVHDELYRHDYPFCWRADEDPLIQMARPAWFIRTTAEIERAIANNQTVSWLPAHIKDGRFGDFLANNVDWALSRERYWGTPLNVWRCTKCEHAEAPSSVAELEARNPSAFSHFRAAKAADPNLDENLMVHKPWIDEVTFPCAQCGAEMRRVSEVIDCWFDSGCMPFAQWGYPHVEGSRRRFDQAFPADFISEAIDQTRGWFYSLLMVSSLVFDTETQARMGLSTVRAHPHPFRTCIVLGHVCDRDGKKESKSKGNYTPPHIILDRVRMDFAVLGDDVGVTAAPGEALIGREDLDGMDLADGARVAVYRSDAEGKQVELAIKAHKKLPRRVVVLPVGVRSSLGVEPVPAGIGTRPVDVPALPPSVRVTVEDEATPAPGADAFRWFFYAASPPWTNTRHSLKNVRTLQKDFLVKLRNVYSFFVIYANIDRFRPELAARARPVAERSVLDRWMLSELNLAVEQVRAALDGYLVFDAASCLVDLVEGVSNWWVRRSRARFWAPVGADGAMPAEKLDAYATLYETLTTIAHLIAPFVPFFAEEMYQNLVRGVGIPDAAESVHLADYPAADGALVDRRLAEEMAAVREIISLGLSVRTANRLKVRQPLAQADVVFNDGALAARVEAYRRPIEEELNIHEVRIMYPGHEAGAVTFRMKPNFRALGARLGKRVQLVKAALEAGNGELFHAELAREGKVTLSVEGEPLVVGPDELEVTAEAASGFAAETGAVGVVVLHTTLTEALVDEGLLRELVSRVQGERKELGLEYTDRVWLSLGGGERILRVAREGIEHLKAECLAAEVRFDARPGAAKEVAMGEETLLYAVRRA
ncbi:MAG: class I tRNA ligase family protein [Polyangiaceae bacterium]|nr:class I tRNA ligase family protein [Polyangiaceae bacterium]